MLSTLLFRESHQENMSIYSGTFFPNISHIVSYIPGQETCRHRGPTNLESFLALWNACVSLKKKNDYAFCHMRTQRCFPWDLRVICLKPRKKPAHYFPIPESKSPLSQILPPGHKTASCRGYVRGLFLLWCNQLANADGHLIYQENLEPVANHVRQMQHPLCLGTGHCLSWEWA